MKKLYILLFSMLILLSSSYGQQVGYKLNWSKAYPFGQNVVPIALENIPNVGPVVGVRLTTGLYQLGDAVTLGLEPNPNMFSHGIFALNGANGNALFAREPYKGFRTGTASMKVNQANGNIFEAVTRFSATSSIAGAILKYNANGDSIWAASSSHIPSANSSLRTYSIDIDENENVLVASILVGSVRLLDGKTGATDHTGDNDLLIYKISADGTQLLWSRKIVLAGATAQNDMLRVAYNATTNKLIVIGELPATSDFAGTELEVATGDKALYYFEANGGDGTISNVKKLVSGTGASLRIVSKLSLDNSGNIYFGGNYTGSFDFDPSAGSATGKNVSGVVYGFYAKYTANGELVWSRQFDIKSETGFSFNMEDLLVLSNGFLLNGFTTDTLLVPQTGGGFKEVVFGNRVQVNPAFLQVDLDGHYVWHGAIQPLDGSGHFGGTFKTVLDQDNNVYFTLLTSTSGAQFFNREQVSPITPNQGLIIGKIQSGIAPSIVSTQGIDEPICVNTQVATMSVQATGSNLLYRWRNVDTGAVLPQITTNTFTSAFGPGSRPDRIRSFSCEVFNDFGSEIVTFEFEVLIPSPITLTREGNELVSTSSDVVWLKGADTVQVGGNRLTLFGRGFYQARGADPQTGCLVNSNQLYVPGRIYVAPEAQGLADGSSWDNAMTLATAFSTMGFVYTNPETNLPEIDQVWMKEGVYRNVPTNNRAFTLGGGTADFYGGFTGTETSLEQRDWRSHATIIDGRAPGTEDQASVLIFYNSSLGISFNGIQFQNSGNGQNAAITVVNGASLGFENCHFINFNGGSTGGAINISSFSGAAPRKLSIVNSYFENISAQVGGVVYVMSSFSSVHQITVSGSVFKNINVSARATIAEIGNIASTNGFNRWYNNTFIELNGPTQLFNFQINGSELVATELVNNIFKTSEAANSQIVLSTSGNNSPIINLRVANNWHNMPNFIPGFNTPELYFSNNFEQEVQLTDGYVLEACAFGQERADESILASLSSVDFLGNTRKAGRLDIGAVEAQTAGASDPVIILSSPQSADFCDGERIVLRIEYEGVPVSIAWLSPEGQVVSTADSLVIESFSTEWYGAYALSIADECQTQTVDFALGNPFRLTNIQSGFPDNTLCLGNNINLSVFASNVQGAPQAVSYQWYKDGEAIDSATNNQLNLINIQFSDFGVYYAIASNGCSQLQSEEFNLSFEQETIINPDLLSLQGNGSLCEGANFTIQPLVYEVGFALDFQWFKDGFRLSDAEPSSFLPFTNLTAENSGLYTLKVITACTIYEAEFEFEVIIETIAVQVSQTNFNICEGGSLELSASTTVADPSFEWFKNGSSTGITSAVLTIEEATNNDAGNYYVVVSGECTQVQSESISVSFGLGLSLNNQSSDQEVCANEEFTLVVEAGGVNSYRWFKNEVMIPNATSDRLVITQSEPQATYKAILTGCTVTQETEAIVVTTKSAPQIENVEIAYTRCPGSELTIIAEATGEDVTYRWLEKNLRTNQTTEVGTNLILQYVTITDAVDIILEASNDCGTVEKRVGIILLGDAPNFIQDLEPAVICQGESTTFVVEAFSQTQYAWYLDGQIIEGQNTASLTASQAGLYKVIASNCFGATSSEEVALTLTPLPNVSAGADVAVCAGESVTLTATGSDSYVWSDGIQQGLAFVPTETKTYTVTGTTGDCSATAQITVSVVESLTVSAGNAMTVCAGESVTLTATGATTYSWSDGVQQGVAFVPTETKTYTVTGSSGSCSETDEVTVTVVPLPTVSAGADVFVCAGESVTLTATGSDSYVWSDGIQQGLAFVPTETKTYTVTGTTGDCSVTAQITVSVVESLTVSAGNAMTVCAGESVTLTATGATTYSWSDGVQQGVAFVPSETKTYTVTGSSGSCSATDEITITVLPNPTVSAGADITVCVGESVTLTATGATTYVWSDGVQQGVAFVPTETKIYTVTGANGNCTATADVMVTVLPSPTVSAGADFTVCAGESVTLIATGATTYVWSDGVQQGVAFVPTETKIYIVTGANGNCTATADVMVTVLPSSTVSAGADITVCAGESVTLSATGATNYSWSDGVSQGMAFVPTETKTYTVTGINGNCSATDQVTVTVIQLPTPTITQNNGALSTQVFASYQWLKDGAEITGATSQSFTPAESGTYSVRVANAANCEGTSEGVIINVLGIESELNNAVRVYPNPTKDIITIQFEGMSQSIKKVEVYNNKGQVLEIRVRDNQSLDLSNVPAGMYWVRIVTEQGSVTRKIIRE